MQQKDQKIQYSFGVIYCTIALVAVMIGANFSRKLHKPWRKVKPVRVERARFSLQKGEKGHFVLAHYFFQGKEFYEPLRDKKNTCFFEDVTSAKIFLEDVQKEELQAYRLDDGKLVLYKSSFPWKESVYLGLCVFLFLYFVFLKRRILTIFDRGV